MVQIPKKKLNDGTMIPVLGLGTWQMEEKTCSTAIPLALELGYRHIDTAFAYYNEQFVGKALASFPREELFVTTKLWRDFHDPKKVEEGCDASLKSLNMPYLDLYLIHWPERKNMVEILEAMQKLKEKGKILSMGVCNATISHLEELIKQKVPISVNQVEYHPFLNQEKLLQFCQKHQIAVTAYSPIGRGKVFKEKLLVDLGKAHGKTAAQVALKWLLQKGLVVIPKGSSKGHLQENIEIFDFTLSDQEMAQIDKLHRNERMICPDFNEF